MGKSLETYTWHVKLLTPLHIGSGESLWEKFDFVTIGKETIVLNQEEIWEASLFNGNEPSNLTLLKQKPADLVNEEELGIDSPFVSYRMMGSPQGAEVRAQIKDVRLRPYIPGSSLKGAIRTILLWFMIQEGHIKVSEHNLQNQRESAAEAIEKTAFGSDANHDLLRALRIGDSNVAPPHALRMLNAYAFAPKSNRKRQSIPINVEAINSGVEFKVPVTVERYLFQQQTLHWQSYANLLTTEFPKAAQEWAKAYLGNERLFYQQQGWKTPLEVTELLLGMIENMPNNIFLMQIGWGSGWTSKTIGPTLPNKLQDHIIERYSLSRGRRAVGTPFPKSRRLIGISNRSDPVPDLPLGWVLVEMKES